MNATISNEQEHKQLPFAQHQSNGESIKHQMVNNGGLSPLVQSEGLYFCTVQRVNGWKTEFGVYMRHGSPGGRFWEVSSGPLRSFNSRDGANRFIDELAGLHNAHKAFENEVFFR